jgi:hypothetical protein
MSCRQTILLKKALHASASSNKHLPLPTKPHKSFSRGPTAKCLAIQLTAGKDQIWSLSQAKRHLIICQQPSRFVPCRQQPVCPLASTVREALQQRERGSEKEREKEKRKEREMKCRECHHRVAVILSPFLCWPT